MQQYKRSSVRYHRINRNDDGYVDAQFVEPAPKVPYKAIGLAVFLFTLGTILLTVGCLLVTGHIDVKYADRTYPVIVLGLLLFIPGFYHVRIAVYAWKGYTGYSFRDIPDFD
ncbi:transmembrane protein 230-like [Hydractinia symbiolongicarpus]|uniref:transmembrane protein 230-like n=1 Tax=Hydractinia symbiolongicarpus TaxID=13093 RepID=UPI00254C2AA8|nr:transmembrane protein 230-like [Hydractinia symbiolongicarpus]